MHLLVSDCCTQLKTGVQPRTDPALVGLTVINNELSLLTSFIIGPLLFRQGCSWLVCSMLYWHYKQALADVILVCLFKEIIEVVSTTLDKDKSSSDGSLWAPKYAWGGNVWETCHVSGRFEHFFPTWLYLLLQNKTGTLQTLHFLSNRPLFSSHTGWGLFSAQMGQINEFPS